MKKSICLLLLVLVLTGCTSKTGEAVTPNDSQTTAEKSMEDMKTEAEETESLLDTSEESSDSKDIFEDAYICSGDLQKVYDYTWKALGHVYSLGLQDEYRTVIIKDKNYGVLIYKSNACTPFELVSELKHNYAGFGDIKFQAIYDTTAFVFTDESYYYQMVDGTKSRKEYWPDSWLEKNSEIYDEFQDWNRRTNNSGADMSPWQVVDDATWSVWNLYRGSFVYDPEHLVNEPGASMDTLTISSAPVTVYTELYTAGDIIYLDLIKSLK